jgi:hypothetical protein
MIGHPGLLFVVKITELSDFPLTRKNTGEIWDIPMFPGRPIAAITSIDGPPGDFPRSAKFIRNREKIGLAGKNRENGGESPSSPASSLVS